MWWCGYVVMRWKSRIRNLRHWVLCKTTAPIDNATLTDTIFFSPTLKGGKLFIVSCEFWVFLYAKIFFILIMFLREQSWRNSFALKRMEIDAGYEVRVKRCEYFYHKVHGVMVKWWRFWGLWGTLEIVKMWSWNILLFEEILHYAVLRSEWHGSVLYSRIRNMNYQCF